MSRFLKRWNEIWLLPAALLLWIYGQKFIQWIDPTAIPYDSGVLMKLLFATAGIFWLKLWVFFIIKISAKALNSFGVYTFNYSFNSLSDYHKVWVYTAWVFGYLFASILLAGAI